MGSMADPQVVKQMNAVDGAKTQRLRQGQTWVMDQRVDRTITDTYIPKRK